MLNPVRGREGGKRETEEEEVREKRPIYIHVRLSSLYTVK